jgi:hypothetical protein
MPMQTFKNDYEFRKRRIGKQYVRSWLPRRCFLSNKPLWFKECVVVVTMITGPGDIIFTNYWCDKKEYLLDELKGETWAN